MANIDIAEQKLKSLLEEVREDLPSIESEEDAKVKIINRIFNECLGWSFTTFSCENNHENGFSDYILKIGGVESLVVEAKRIGILGVESAVTDKYRTLKISGSVLKPSIQGIRQAHSYASEVGIPISVVTDGITWIVFKTWVQGSYREKEAFVFPSLEAVENSFSVFYELLSYDCFTAKTFNVLFDELHNSRQYLTLPLTSAIEPSEINILQKSPIAFDLEKILNSFFTQLIGDENSEIKEECFVESNESRIADYSLEKITNSVLNNLPHDNNRVGSELSDLIEGNVQAEMPSDSDLSVFIVGPTGSGKTTYIDRFFSKILPKSTREHCLTININCLDASGDASATVSWLTEAIITFLEKELFEEGFPAYNDLRGMYFSQYKRMASGYLKKIYENDRETFDEKFADFLEKEVHENREGYLESLLHFTINNRKKLPIIIADNTDEFTLDFKVQIFQLCNSYRRKVKLCMLMFPVTDKSAWSFSKTDIFTIHQSRSFFLPTPSPREVFRKRIEFLNKKLITADTTERKEYLSSKGIRIELKDISKFAQVLEDVFVENNFTAKTLGELTNYNIRSIMNLSKRIITSPVMKIEDLITSYVTTEPISFAKFIDALLRGDYEAYRVSTGEDFGVISTFKVSPLKVHSPLLNLRVLALLRVKKQAGRNVEERHLTIQSITSYFEALGVDTVDVESCLTELVSLRLVEPYDPSASVLNDVQKLAITYKGLAHYDLSTRNSVYFYQMAITTGISDPEVAANIRSYYKSNRSFSDITSYIRRQFSDYLIHEDKKYINAAQDKEQFECQRDLIRDIKAFSAERSGFNGVTQDNYSSFLGEKLIGKVKLYDPEKDFGFISLSELNDEVYFKVAKLERNELETIHDGDVVYCTLGQGNKGVQINTIDGFVEGKNEISTEKCSIKFYNVERGFGFAFIGTTSNEAFFHKTAFPHNFYEHLKEGLAFQAEIRLKDDGKYQVRRCIDLIQ
ncbi:cold shock domain-containing protein [Vibrio parahaemolyticus]|uniref:cold shock domain-containing protein n=1 Tax=Vibrio parahaemolyticus TaxID=670 RepID=UPI001D4004F8|nr:cold shock domain-containing protein [Vibrio parahaemolyticus]MBE3969206.1 cold shock domain-containing protein [Vibrio parahaemolyticus]MBE5115439.1 cold shock domain-containing protein [Vibrio parahaemolyticus]HCG8540269.1 cold shock domain-containing protein [Vibrio parahaemolyticus]HCG9590817.1 cold shock domain-containing protein [Vibrio parahaemolyticus]